MKTLEGFYTSAIFGNVRLEYCSNKPRLGGVNWMLEFLDYPGAIKINNDTMAAFMALSGSFTTSNPKHDSTFAMTENGVEITRTTVATGDTTGGVLTFAQYADIVNFVKQIQEVGK